MRALAFPSCLHQGMCTQNSRGTLQRQASPRRAPLLRCPPALFLPPHLPSPGWLPPPPASARQPTRAEVVQVGAAHSDPQDRACPAPVPGASRSHPLSPCPFHCCALPWGGGCVAADPPSPRACTELVVGHPSARGRNKDVPHLEGHVPKVAQATGQKGHLAARAAGKVIAF